MTLEHIVRITGGEVYAGGLKASIPAPHHTAEDRSVSLLLDKGRLVVNTYGRTSWREVLDHLRSEGLISSDNRITGAGGQAAKRMPPVDHKARIAAASEIWSEGKAVVGTLSETHCRLRQIKRSLPGPHVLRHRFNTPLQAYGGKGASKPALLAAISDPAGVLTAVEVTYLAPSGHRSTNLRFNRKAIGVIPPGSAVRLDPVASEMLVGEGLFTTLSASERFNLPAWALLSSHSMRSWVPPTGVERLLIAADRGEDGERSADRLCRSARALGLGVEVVLPPEGRGDWNDLAREKTP